MNPISLISLTCRLYRPAQASWQWLAFKLCETQDERSAPPPGARRFMPGEKGQGLAEYALIFALVALAVIAVLALLGPAVVELYEQAACAVILLGDFDPSVDYSLDGGACSAGG